jgi:23S rRNA pseudouridine1911/1915/1917 synthase
MKKNDNEKLMNSNKEIKFSYIVLENDKELLVKGLLKRRIGISTRLMRKLKDSDGVFKNNISVKMNEKLSVGDLITVCLPDEHSEFISEEIKMEVCYEDNDLLIVNKPAGIVVHPTKGHQTGTVANGIMHYMEMTNQSFKVRFINRLDKDTSGLLIVGKNSFSQDEMSKQMEENNIIKKYIAVVKGHFENEEGTIDLPIGQEEGEIRRIVNAEGFASVTHYKVIKEFEKDYTMIQLILETGRTHQIRVHLKHIGHPIVSDSLYGESEPELINRQALHAEYLSFNHPIRKDKIEVWAKIPEDIEKLITLIS